MDSADTGLPADLPSREQAEAAASAILAAGWREVYEAYVAGGREGVAALEREPGVSGEKAADRYEELQAEARAARAAGELAATMSPATGPGREDVVVGRDGDRAGLVQRGRRP